MGTPEFAVESLKQLLNGNFDVAAVVTTPDKPAGRGLKIRESAVKQYAVQNHLPVLQPVHLKDDEFIRQLRSFEANLFIVVAFRKLPDAVWMMPELGTFNLHASLLPQYRGAAPINHALINGEAVSGVTTFFLNSEIDTGKIIMNRSVTIGPDETAGELHDRLMAIGGQLVVETVQAIAGGQFSRKEQTSAKGGLKPAPKIFREHCLIDWTKPVQTVHNMIRGLSPYPCAHTFIKTDRGPSEIKIIRSRIIEGPDGKTAGEILIMGNRRIMVCCGDGFIEIMQLQASGKKAMSAEEFLRGYRASTLCFDLDRK